MLRDEDGVLTQTAKSLTKGRTDSILKILRSDEKRNLVAFLYGSGLISRNGDNESAVVSLSGSDLSYVELSGASLQKAGFGSAILRSAVIIEADLDGVDLRGLTSARPILPAPTCVRRTYTESPHRPWCSAASI